MELSIIIISWNAKRFLKACLKSIYACRPSDDFEVIVVDNCSSDDSVEMVQKNFPQAILIRNKELIYKLRASTTVKEVITQLVTVDQEIFTINKWKNNL